MRIEIKIGFLKFLIKWNEKHCYQETDERQNTDNNILDSQENPGMIENI